VQIDDIAIEELVTDQIERDEMLELVCDALDKLPKKQRDVFIKTEIQEMTFQEISDETGVSINTLLSQKRYAIKKMREILTDN